MAETTARSARWGTCHRSAGWVRFRLAVYWGVRFHVVGGPRADGVERSGRDADARKE